MPTEGPIARDGPFGVLDAYLGSLTIRHDLRLRSEARADEIAGIIRVSGAFLSRAPELKRHELAHEAAHLAGLDDWYLRSHADWDLAARVSFGHLNGQTRPGEVIAEAYATHWTDPGFLRLHAAGLIPAVREGSRALGLPLPARQEPGSSPDGPGRLPPGPGTAPVPAGHIRLWHCTPLRNAAPVREHGLLRSYARGDSGAGGPSDPSAGVCASTRRPDDVLRSPGAAAAVVEFHARPSELSTAADHYRDQEPGEWAKGCHYVIMKGDVPPSQIAAVHEPWHSAARYMRDGDPSLLSYRWVMDDPGPDLEPYRRGLRALLSGTAAERARRSDPAGTRSLTASGPP